MLMRGSTNRVVDKNIRLLMRNGYSRKQAVAIAYRHAGRSKKHSKSTRRVSSDFSYYHARQDDNRETLVEYT